MYNLSNLEPKFKNFLHAENISSVSLRNYLSDSRHFLGWLVSKGKFDERSNLEQNISYLTPNVIEEYKNDHIASALPSKTINLSDICSKSTSEIVPSFLLRRLELIVLI